MALSIWRGWRGIAAVAVGMALFLAVLEFRYPRCFSWDDNSSQFLPFYVYNYRCVVDQMTVPQIAFNIFLGDPYYAQGQTGVLYFPAYLAVALSDKLAGSPLWTLDILAITHLIGGALGMFALLRLLRVNGSIAVAGALMYGTLPFSVLVSKSWIFVAYTAFYAPWGFYLVERMAHGGRWGVVLISAFLKTLFFYQGYTQYCFYLTLLEGGYLLLRLWPQGWRSLFSGLSKLGVANLISLILILPLYLPMREALAASAYRQSALPISILLGLAVDPGSVILAHFFKFIPGLFFDASNAFLFCGGSVFLFYFIWRAIRIGIRWRRTPFLFAGLMLLTGALSTRLYLLVSWLPFFNILRWPFKWYFFFDFFLVITFAVLMSHGIRASGFRYGRVLFPMIAILLQVVVVFQEKAQIPLGPLRIESRSDLESSWNKRDGRVLNCGFLDDVPVYPGLMAYNYPLLTNTMVFSGYDQMISATHAKLTFNYNVTGAHPFPMTQSRLDQLSDWSVRYLTIVSAPAYEKELSSFSQLKKIHQDDRMIVFENQKALPFAAWQDQPTLPLPIQFGVNRLEVTTTGRGGELVLSVIAMKHYWIREDDGKFRPLKPMAGKLVCTILPGVRRVTVQYRQPVIEFCFGRILRGESLEGEVVPE